MIYKNIWGNTREISPTYPNQARLIRAVRFALNQVQNLFQDLRFQGTKIFDTQNFKRKSIVILQRCSNNISVFILCNLVVIIFLFFGCDLNPLVYRMGANYVPIESIGNQWTYLLEDSTEKTVKVTGTAVVGGRSSFVVDDNFTSGFWWKGPEGVDRYVLETRFINNQVVEIEKRWRPHLLLPLVLGNHWIDEYEKETIVFGDTICRRVVVEGKVDSILTLTVPSGTFEECYKVRMDVLEITCSPFEGDTCNVSCDTLRAQHYEYYAPDVGLIKREEIGGLSEEELITYTVQ
jgi:hypothetical protein